MEMNLNIGIAKAIVVNKITNELVLESKIDSNKDSTIKLVETIKKYPYLINEFNVINNIENAHIENEILATKFIDHNLKLVENFNINEINEAYNSLKSFVNNDEILNIDENKINLYNSISTLIIESVKKIEESDIKKIHRSYENILSYLKTNINETDENYSINLLENVDIDQLIEIATKKYNEKYSSLDENEKRIVITAVNGSDGDKKELFEQFKNDNINTLKTIESNGIEDKINEAIDKLNKMTYSNDNFVENMKELYALNRSLN